MSKLSLKNILSLEGEALDVKIQEEQNFWKECLNQCQTVTNPSDAVKGEMEAIKIIINDPEVLKMCAIHRVQQFIDDQIRDANEEHSVSAKNLDKKSSNLLLYKLHTDFDCQGIDFENAYTIEDVRRKMYEAAGIEYISLNQVLAAYNAAFHSTDDDASISRLKYYADLSDRAHITIDNSCFHEPILGRSYRDPKQLVAWYQEMGLGKSVLVNEAKDLSTIGKCK